VKAGQFFMLKSAAGAAFLPRAISVCDSDGERVTMLVQNVGRGTAELCALRPSDAVVLTGPLGNGWPLDELSGHVALVGGGIGVAPMLLTAKRLRNADCYLGYRGTPFYADEIKPHAKNLRISTGSSLVTDIFSPHGYDYVLCCGPLPMMQAVTKLCEAAGVPVYVSLETRMACGVGGCLVCACATKEGKNLRACIDGPVFRGEAMNLES
jgi:dihydroorotate dehydrogenase electron transfer subunit